MSDFPSAVLWVGEDGAENTATIQELRALVRARTVDDETQVFAESVMDGFASLAESRANLGISAGTYSESICHPNP
jgi:hypothetical protein